MIEVSKLLQNISQSATVAIRNELNGVVTAMRNETPLRLDLQALSSR